MKPIDVSVTRLAARQYSLAHRVLHFTWFHLTRRARYVVGSVQRQLVLACPA